MWTRAELKRNAKIVLKRNYWLTFIVLLAGGLISGFGGGVSSCIDVAVELDMYVPESLILGASVFGFLMAFLVGGPIIVGMCRFLMKSREQDTEFADLFSGFNADEFGKNVKVMFLKQIKITLWTFLMFIPGIIKAYEYYFVQYIQAENPHLPQQRVFQLSKEMTRGYKWDIFVLELSFLGWNLLGAMCLGVGILFVNPYYEATLAELYAAQRAYVLSAGIASEEELCGFSGYTQSDYTDWQ